MLREDPNTFYCCRRYKFAIQTLLCNVKYVYIVESDMQLNNIQRMQLAFPLQQRSYQHDTVLSHSHSTFVF